MKIENCFLVVKKIPLALTFAALVLALFCGGLPGAVPEAANSARPENAQEREKILSRIRQERQQHFEKQKNRDALSKVTDNSFLNKKFHPVSGGVVLLVAKVGRWDLQNGEGGTIFDKEFRSKAAFQVRSGGGKLIDASNFSVGKGNGPEAVDSLEVLADVHDMVSCWLRLPTQDHGTVVVLVSLSANGARGGFIDPRSQVQFTVDYGKSDGGRALASLPAAIEAYYQARKQEDQIGLETEVVDLEADEKGRWLEKRNRRLKMVHANGATKIKDMKAPASQANKGDLGSLPFVLDLDALKKGALERPTELTHLGPDGFAVLAGEGYWPVIQVYENDHEDLGPQETVMTYAPSLDLAGMHTLRSKPSQNSPRRWLEETEFSEAPNGRKQTRTTRRFSLSGTH